jgi:hypothetical protein
MTAEQRVPVAFARILYQVSPILSYAAWPRLVGGHAARGTSGLLHRVQKREYFLELLLGEHA